MALIDMAALALSMTGDESGRLGTEDAGQALTLALLRYGGDRPRLGMALCPVLDDGRGLALPDGWDAGLSRVTGIEYPAGRNPPAALPVSGWEERDGPAGREIILTRGGLPGESALLRFTSGHSAESVPDKDAECVAHWAAALLLDRLASLHSGDKQSSIEADSVDHAARGNTYAARAAEHRKHYLDHLGLDPKRTVAFGRVLTVGGGGLLHARPGSRPVR